jgi:ABC-type transport system substrate-binding protein
MPSTFSRRGFLGGAMAGAAALPFLGRGRAVAATPGVLTFGLSSYPPSFLPWNQAGTAAGTVKLLIHRGLLGYDKTGALRGELAESWAAEGTKAWVFKLRDAKFHNGKPVTSADVKWTIEQVAAEKSTAYFRGQFRVIGSVETPDDKTVRLVMKEPAATIPDWFAHYNMPILPMGSDSEGTVGAGPFMLKERERGVSITLEAFAGYYKPGLPKLKGISIVAFPDENLRVAALDAGNVDLIEYVPWQSMKAIEGNSGLSLDAVDGPFMYLTFNGSKPPFNNPKVRKAVAHAIKREDVLAAAFFGRGAPLAHLPIGEDSPFFNPELENGWAYDPELSKKLLAEAGLSGGITCTMLSTAQYGMHKDTAEVCQQHLAAVGIMAELNLPDWSTRIQLGNRGQYDIAVMGTSADSNDPDGLSNVIDGSLPPSFSRSFGVKIPAMEAKLAAGRAEFDIEKRKAIYKEMETIAIAEVPLVGLSWRSQGYAMKKAMTGFKNMPGQLTFYSGLTLEETELG